VTCSACGRTFEVSELEAKAVGPLLCGDESCRATAGTPGSAVAAGTPGKGSPVAASALERMRAAASKCFRCGRPRNPLNGRCDSCSPARDALPPLRSSESRHELETRFRRDTKFVGIAWMILGALLVLGPCGATGRDEEFRERFGDDYGERLERTRFRAACLGAGLGVALAAAGWLARGGNMAGVRLGSWINGLMLLGSLGSARAGPDGTGRDVMADALLLFLLATLAVQWRIRRTFKEMPFARDATDGGVGLRRP
jgi:hypothetical protein